MKTFKQFLLETDHLDLYRRYSTGINKDLITGNHKEGKFSFMKHYDTSGKGEHEYEHHDKSEVLHHLDNHTTHHSNALKKPVVSYSGVNSAMGKKLHDAKPGHTMSTPAYISSSHDPKIAHKFAELNDQKHRHVMVFHLPKGYHKSKAIPNAREGGKSHTDERLFARNQNFKHLKTTQKSNTFYHHYKPE